MAQVEQDHTVIIRLKAATPFRMKDKVALLNNVSNLKADDQERILKICNNPKALQGLATHWDTLQTMFK